MTSWLEEVFRFFYDIIVDPMNQFYASKFYWILGYNAVFQAYVWLFNVPDANLMTKKIQIL